MAKLSPSTATFPDLFWAPTPNQKISFKQKQSKDRQEISPEKVRMKFPIRSWEKKRNRRMGKKGKANDL